MNAKILAAVLLVFFEALWSKTPALRPHRAHFRAMLALFWGAMLAIYAIDALNLAPRLYFQGVPRFASDAATYQWQAETLAQRARAGSIDGFFDHQYFNYSRMLAALFLVFGNQPLVGNTFNAVFYMASLVSIFFIGREFFNERVGLLAAWMFACFPTFLLHETQTLRWPSTTAALHVAALGTILLLRSTGARIGIVLMLLGFAVLVNDLPYIARLFVVAVAVFSAVPLLSRTMGRERFLAAARLIVVAVLLGAWFHWHWATSAPDPHTVELRRHAPRDESLGAAEHPLRYLAYLIMDRLDRVISPILVTRTGFILDADELRRSGVVLGTSLEGSELGTLGEFLRNVSAALGIALVEPTIPRLLSASASSSGLRKIAAVEMMFYYAVLAIAVAGLVLALRAGGMTRIMVVFILLLSGGAYILLGTTILNGGTLHRLRQPYVAFHCVFASSAVIWLRDRHERRRRQETISAQASVAH